MRKFLAKFLLSFIVLYALFHLADFEILKQIVLSGTSLILDILGKSYSVSGAVISTGTMSFAIVASCTGVVSFSIFTALLYATGKARSHFPYIAAAIPLFLVWNILRASATVYFESVLLHHLLWMGSLFLILALYLAATKEGG